MRKPSDMPVRSLNSSVLRWPKAEDVLKAVRQWAEDLSRTRKEVLAVGYFGSMARGEWGVGSDLDLVLIVESSPQPFLRRSAGWDTTALPVPVDLLVYTPEEWRKLRSRMKEEVVWIYRSL